MLQGYTISPLGDQAITLTMGNTINLAINRQIIQLSASIQAQNIPGIKDIIPAYSSLTIGYDHFTLLAHLQPDTTPYQYLHHLLTNLANQPVTKQQPTCKQVDIPVCYDETFAPDINHVAMLNTLTVQQVIAAHVAVAYQVYMVGFLPGFAYLGTVPNCIATPRHAQPRTSVPAGSIGIAGHQTGIYPFDSPGGWQLIGRTPVEMFNPNRPAPALLQPGDIVRFYPISLLEYNNYWHHEHLHN